MSDMANKAVFLSYASQDAEAAKRICDALRQTGIEVWFDQSELRGGDAWDQKIRRQIKECALFMPVISANTQSRPEGYFRLEWKLAVDRSHLLADDHPFLFPVVIDDTSQGTARVPDKFRDVQWTWLRMGETASELATRVARLLAGVGAANDRPADPELPGRRDRRDQRPGWLRHAWSAIALVLVIYYGLGPLWRSKHGPAEPATVADAKAPAAAVQLSQARQLARRALVMIEEPNPSRETLESAGQLIEQAKALDPAEAEVWAVGAEVDTWTVFYLFDISEARKERAQSESARALTLDPKSSEARLARAFVLITVVAQPAVAPEAEALLRGLLQEKPDDSRALETLANLLRGEGRNGEAAALFVQADSLNAAGWAYFLAGRIDDAVAVVDRALVADRSVPNLELKSTIESYGREDLDAGQAALDQLPASALLEDHPASVVVFSRRVRREPEKMLDVLRAISRDWLSSSQFVGPKGFLTGQAQQMANRPEAAEADWRAALQLVEQRLATRANAPDLLLWKADLLACLGEQGKAEHLLDLELQLSGPKADQINLNLQRKRIALRIGRREEVLNWLETALRSPERYGFLHGIARFDPVFDPLRGDPRFEKLLRDTLPKGAKPFDDPKLAARAPAPDQKSVAVLAFANLSDDKDNEYFSDGISEELLNVLAKVPGLKVTARTSSFYFKGRNAPIAEIARELGVAYVVEGSVRRAGNRVRIAAELIKAADGFQVWSDDFDRELKDVFAVQDEIAGLVAKNLQLKLGGSAAVAPAVDPEAYRLYLEGRQALQRRTSEGYAQAEKLFTQARTITPAWAPVYAGLADTARLRGWGTETGPTGPDSAWNQDMKDAKALAEQALQLDPGSAEADVALGGIHMIAWRSAEAEQFIRRALELNPNSADAYLVLGRILSADGRMDEAIAALRRAADLNPLAPRILDNLAAELWFAGRFDEGWAIIERATALQPDSTQIQCYRARMLTGMGRREEALDQALRLTENRAEEERDFRLLEAARVYAVFGLQDKAEATAAGVTPGTAESVIACAYIRHPERALSILHQINFGWIEDLIWGRDFDSIRADPQYQSYLASTGLLEPQKRALAWRAAHPLPTIPAK